MRSLKVLLSHPCPYPLCRSVEPPRRNVQPQKDLGMKISQGRDSCSHLFHFPSTPVSNYIITSPLVEQHGHRAPPLHGVLEKDGWI